MSAADTDDPEDIRAQYDHVRAQHAIAIVQHRHACERRNLYLAAVLFGDCCELFEECEILFDKYIKAFEARK